MEFPEMSDYRSVYDRFRWNVPERFNFGVEVIDRFAAEPDRPAMIWCNEAGEERRLTFADVAAASDRLANVLRAQGIGKGDRVIVMLPRVPEWQIAMIAVLKLGAVVVPCITMLTESDLAFRIGHSGARGVITTTENTAKIGPEIHLAARVAIGGGPAGWADYEAELARAAPDLDPVEIAAEDPVAIYYTSGTTGYPKGVTHVARALYVWRTHAKYWLDLREGDLMWCTADTGWSKAGTSILFGPWSWGTCVLFYDGPFDAAKRLELLAGYGVTVFCAAATELRQLVYQDVAAHDLTKLRHTVSAGESLNPEIAAKWAALTGRPVHEGYGQTETLMSVHNYPVTPQKPGSTGLPLPGFEIAVLDAEHAVLPAGKPGTLAIMLPNPNVMAGYWGEPDRMATQLASNDAGDWWLTGDTAHLDEEGYVFFHGRSDDVISSAGYRIGPSEVENALLEHDAVAECAAVASPDPERGEVVKAFIVLAEGHAPSDALVEELQGHAKAMTAPYKYPRKIAFVDDLPKNVAGKILRGQLRDGEFGG